MQYPHSPCLYSHPFLSSAQVTAVPSTVKEQDLLLTAGGIFKGQINWGSYMETNSHSGRGSVTTKGHNRFAVVDLSDINRNRDHPVIRLLVSQ